MKSPKVLRENHRHILKQSFAIDFFKDHRFDIDQLNADASFRKYDRITYKDKTFVLMDCPREHYALNPFIVISEFLLKNNFSAPEVYHVDHDNGFLILEDFGDLSIADHLHGKSLLEIREIYKLILDLLTKIQNTPKMEFIDHYSKASLMHELEVYTNWYVPYVTGRYWDNKQQQDFLNIWDELLNLVPDSNHCNVLRDYHVQNMMLLPNRQGIKSIGLLDFQDAVIGSPIYDVVSVLEDARIEVSRDFALLLLDYYLTNNKNVVRRHAEIAYHVLGAQRNQRILGVFARKAKRDKALHYLKYIPLVLKYLEYDLTHACMGTLKSWLKENI